MAEGKNSFVLYKDIIYTVRKLPKEKQADLFMTILEYVNDENPEVEDIAVDLVFTPIKHSLKRDLIKYEKICERNKKNGEKGGRPPKPKKPTRLNGNPPEMSKPRKADSDSDSDTDIDTDIDTEKRDSKLSTKNSSAFDLLKREKSTELESFEMQNKKQVQKWKDLVESFNDTIEIETKQGKIQFDADQLMPRLRKYTRSWINNQTKYSKTPEPESYESGKLERF